MRYGTSLDKTVKQLEQFATLFDARTAQQFQPMDEMPMKAALISPGSLSELETQSSYLAPLLRRDFSRRNLIQLAVAAQREGGKGAITPENVANVLAGLQYVGRHRGPFALGGQGWIGAMRLGLPQFTREHHQYALGELEHFLMRSRQQLGDQRFLTSAQLAFGATRLRRVEQLAKPQTTHQLALVARQLQRMSGTAQVNHARLDTFNGQLQVLGSNFHSLTQALGQPLAMERHGGRRLHVMDTGNGA